MSIRKDWRTRVDDIIEYATHILTMTDGMDKATLAGNVTVQFAVIHCIEIMGEAARHVPPDVQALCPEVEWRLMNDMRNVLAHGYGGVDLAIVWAAIQNRVLQTREQLNHFLNQSQIPLANFGWC